MAMVQFLACLGIVSVIAGIGWWLIAAILAIGLAVEETEQCER